VANNGDNTPVCDELTGDCGGFCPRAFIVAFDETQRSAAHPPPFVDVGDGEIDSLFVHATERFFPRPGHADVNRL
jgi:hypothetical protein